MADAWDALPDAPAAAADPWDALPDAPAPTAANEAAALVGSYGKGVAGMVGLPGTVVGLLDKGMDEFVKLPERGVNLARGKGFTASEIAPEDRSPFGSDAIGPGKHLPDGGAIVSAVESLFGGKLPTPETTVGKYAGTVLENVPGAGRQLISQALIPGLASEAAGQATEGTMFEPFARLLASIGS